MDHLLPEETTIRGNNELCLETAVPVDCVEIKEHNQVDDDCMERKEEVESAIDRTDDKSASDRTDDKSASDRTDDKSASDRTDDKSASDRTDNKSASDRTDDKSASDRTDDKSASVRTDDKSASDRTDDKSMEIVMKTSKCAVSSIRKPGYACIKPEFLVLDYKPVLHTEFLSDTTKLQLQTMDMSSGDKFDNEPPAKKAKLKGRNKHRPKNEKLQAKDKMCPAIQMNQVCTYGEKCIYNHDKMDFMKKKPLDLDGSCYLFNSFGKCHFGLTCRFAKSHLSDNFDNIINIELYEKMKDYKILNELSVDVKKKLWKKKYNFQVADSKVKEVCKNVQNWNHSGHSSDRAREIEENASGATINLKTIPLDPLNSASTELKTITETANVGYTLYQETEKRAGSILDEEIIHSRPAEKVKIDFKNKLYLAPLTTVGNLPFRRICKSFGADITCGEMALSTQLLQAKLSEWSLIKRHPSEDLFGVQLCGAYPDTMTRCAQLLTETCNIDFIDINCGCPIELICKKGAGSALMSKPGKLEQICRSMLGVMGDVPLTVKLRTGEHDGKNVAHNLIPRLRSAGVSLVTIHGRSKAQRYTRLADWNYISECAAVGSPMSVYGNGDILSFEDANLHLQQSGVSGLMIARGALIKPWLFTEIKEQRHWDISSSERFDLLKTYTNYGLEHWGSDHQGVENTRRFLLEWLSFLHRYIPVGVLEIVPQRINERPPYFVGRNDLETLMASASCADWIKISEMLLGPVPDNFHFLPKHKANAYQ